MKKTTTFLIQLLLCLSIAWSGIIGLSPATAAMMPNQQIQAVQGLEDTLFAIHYDQEPLSSRLSRLEETVYGQAQTSASIDARITKLQGSLSRTALGPLSPTAAQAAKPSPTSKEANLPASVQSAPSFGNGGNTTANTNAVQPLPGKPLNTALPSAGTGKTSKTGIANGNRPPANVNTAKTTASAPEPGETDYPTVSQMELKTFGKTFPREDITNRLNRLENQVFKMPQTGSLADRTDNLRLVVLGDTGQGAPNITYGPSSVSTHYAGYGQPDPNMNNGGYNFGNNGFPQPPNYGGQGNYTYPPNAPMPGYNPPMPNAGNPLPGYGSASAPVITHYPPTMVNGNNAPTPDILAAMNEVEKEVLGTTYAAEPINTRLDRVENRVFKTTSPDLSSEDRIQRVIAVASAGGAPMTNKARTKTTLQTLLPIILTILPLILL